MPHTSRFADLVDQRIAEFVAKQREHLQALGPDSDEVLFRLTAALKGGKRFRANFAYWGARAVNNSGFDETSDSAFHSIRDAAAALELFHAAALIHDDIMDNSDTRRGRPSMHREFATMHTDRNFAGDPLAFGRSVALLVGDLLLSWSDELFEEGIAALSSRNAAERARVEFNRMRSELIMGQYLDVFEEFGWAGASEAEARTRAERVALYKSAKYSVEAPLRIGAAIGNGTDADLETMSAFGRPVGLAFQLRDDLLGVFGDAELTGKPSGDDLREGKRTVLIAMARATLPAVQVEQLDSVLGSREASASEIGEAQNLLMNSGAVDELEALIARHIADARDALATSQFGDAAKAELDRLAESVAQRTA